MIATLDLVEGSDGIVSPVDYEHGRPMDGDHGLEAWPADRVQVALQAIILREHEFRCEKRSSTTTEPGNAFGFETR